MNIEYNRIGTCSAFIISYNFTGLRVGLMRNQTYSIIILINCFKRLNTGGRTIASDLSVAAFFREVLGRTVCVRLLTDRRFLLLCNLEKGDAK